MKKYVYLVLATALLVGAIIMSGYMINGTDVGVSVTVLVKHSVDNTITANGKLQYKSGRQIRSGSAGIMGELSVRSGDTVKKGDPLFSYYRIDDAYTALISQYSGSVNIRTIMSMASKYASSADLISEVKKYCTAESVVSEYDGTVTDIRYAQDEPFDKNELIMKIGEKQSLEIPVNISESYIGKIKKGMKAAIRFSALPEKSFTGTVTGIADEAAVTSGLTGRETTVEVTISLDGKSDDLRVGYSAACTITLSTDKDVLVLPYELMRSDDRGDYVFVAEKNKARKRYITAGKEYKDGVSVSKGLSQGDAVINESEGLYDGCRVTITGRTVQAND